MPSPPCHGSCQASRMTLTALACSAWRRSPCRVGAPGSTGFLCRRPPAQDPATVRHLSGRLHSEHPHRCVRAVGGARERRQTAHTHPQPCRSCSGALMRCVPLTSPPRRLPVPRPHWAASLATARSGAAAIGTRQQPIGSLFRPSDRRRAAAGALVRFERAGARIGALSGPQAHVNRR